MHRGTGLLCQSAARLGGARHALQDLESLGIHSHFSPQVCTPGPQQPEACDGLDNDCDGTVDDGLGQTTCGIGACIVTVDNCAGGVSQTCTSGTPGTETCSDVGTDDDCDGDSAELVDGVFSGDACTTGLQGVCAAGTTACGVVSLVCNQSTPASSEACDGLDNDCDGTVDSFTETCYTGPAGTEGVGLCTAGTQTCEAGLFNTCSDITPVAELLNDLDDDCDGVVDNGVTIDDVVDELQNIIDNNPGTPLADKVQDALASAQTAINELNKTPPDNQAAAGNIEGAVGSLEDAIKDEGLNQTQGEDLINQLLDVSRQIAVNAIDAANNTLGSDSGKIASANAALTNGDTLRTPPTSFGDFKTSAAEYKVAIAEAEGALP